MLILIIMRYAVPTDNIIYREVYVIRYPTGQALLLDDVHAGVGCVSAGHAESGGRESSE